MNEHLSRDCGDAPAARRWVPAVLLALALACSKNEYAAPPPPTVTVAHPVEQEVTTYCEFSGQTVAFEAVEVRARVQGYLKSMHLTPGAAVKKGDLLFVIEPDLYQSRQDQAEAALASAEAALKAAQAQLEISSTIFERDAGSKTDVVQRTQERDQAQAAVALGKANLEAARLDLSYTQIYAPISGWIDRNRVDVGNLVGAGETTVLATIVQDDPIYAYFQASERDVLTHGKDLLTRGKAEEQGSGAVPGEDPLEVELGLLTEEGYPHAGKVDYVSNRVDPSTGTVELRGVFPNPRHEILPGLFARIRLPSRQGQSLLVPDVAVGSDQSGKFLLTVDDASVVQRHDVTLGARSGELRVIESGVALTDWVIVNGLQRARPGATVTPQRPEGKDAAAGPPDARKSP